LFESAEFFEVYTRVARELDVMPMLPGPTFEILLHARAQGIDYPALVTKMKGAGYVFLDRLVLTLNGGSYEARKQALSGLVETLRPGVTQLIVHLSGNDEEIRHVTGNWENRYNEFRLFTAPETKRLLEDKGVKPITYRQLGKLWRK